MIRELLAIIGEMIKPYPVYAVGGCVRDYILGIKPQDYDFCTPATPDEIEKRIKKSGRRAYLTGKRFGTIGCKIDGLMVEITTFRTESYTKGNRKPKVVYVDSINEDLSRRDFTINAIAARISKAGNIRIIDPFCGEEDLDKKLIKAVGTPKQRFKDDPLRMLRAIRFACRFDFEIEEKTYLKLQRMAVSILTISKERWMMELDKILMCDNVERGLRDLWISNLFKFMIPELDLQLNYNQNSKYHDFTLDRHTTKVVVATPKDINLRWAALLHDIAKPFVRTNHPKGHCNYIDHQTLGAEMANRIATHLKWSNERTKSVIDLIKNHLEDDCPLRKYDNMGKIK